MRTLGSEVDITSRRFLRLTAGLSAARRYPRISIVSSDKFVSPRGDCQGMTPSAKEARDAPQDEGQYAEFEHVADVFAILAIDLPLGFLDLLAVPLVC